MSFSQKEAKKRFVAVFEEFREKTGKSIPTISKEIGINQNTMNDTLNYTKDNLNANFVIAFCLTYKCTTVEYIYSGTKETSTTALSNNVTAFRHSEDCQPLDSDKLVGEFYGYCQSTTYDKIDKFVLIVEKNSSNTLDATLNLECYTQVKGRKTDVINKKLYGKPMFLKPDIVFIVFQAEKGDDMYIMSFKWFSINSTKKIYCRYGALLTPCRDTNRYPQLQSFVFLDAPLNEKYLHYVKGFLKLSEKKIIVPSEFFDNPTNGLLYNNKNVKTLFERCEDICSVKKEFYCFSEETLLGSAKANGVDYDTTAAAIMTLKEFAINPEKVNYPDNNTYSKFLSHLTADNFEI